MTNCDILHKRKTPVSTCCLINNVDHADYKNNGLITKIWGGSGWIFNHSVTFGYPLNPTDEQKSQYKNYFTSLGDVLPCRYCRDSYKKFITEGDTALTDDALENRETLTKWFYRVHQAVNIKLELDYGVTYEDLVEKYESFRAKCIKIDPEKTDEIIKGCVAPLDYKAFSFKKLYYMDAPIMPLKKIKPFIKLAKIRGLAKEYFIFLDLVYLLDGDFTKLKKQSSWFYRNKFCQKQIINMRENAIVSIEEEGIWKGTPTMDELKLLMFLSSNLNHSELQHATEILNCNRLEFELR